MKTLLLLITLLTITTAYARVVSPSSIEVKIFLISEFQTGDSGSARDLVLSQVKHLFGYMQNPEIGPMYGLDANIAGIGAMRWEPEVQVLSDSKKNNVRTIRYQLDGFLLLNKKVADQLLPRGDWQITLPYDLDNYYDRNCTDPHYPERDDFWYFNMPFKRGCDHLRQEPLAKAVTARISPAPKVPDLKVGLDVLRGDNGNGDAFQIASINGFDKSSTDPNDDGRLNFLRMNDWFVQQGFKMSVLSRHKNRPVYLFEKTLQRANGSEVRARIIRLLADTDLGDTKRVTFAKFLKQALQESDVVVYEGHSGLGVNLDLKTIERQLLFSKDKTVGDRIQFNRSKHQIFLFDSCTSYSYYLGMFTGKKDPGTLAVMSHGLASLYGYEIPTTQNLYSDLLDLEHQTLSNDHLTWSKLLGNFERPLGANTFMLNVDINN